MKKGIFSLLVLLALVSQGLAQSGKGYVGISVGPSIPTGDLASKDGDNESAGWANSGAIFDISFAYRLGEGKFGITGLLRGQANPTDAQALADEFANAFPGVTWTVESGMWSIGSLMIGGFGSFPLSDKTAFEPRAMVGFVSASSPELTVTGSGPEGTAWVKQEIATATAFSYLLGAGFRFDLGRRFSLLTNLDYLGANPEFSNVESTNSDGERYMDTWSQEMGSVNIGVGIGIRF